MPKGCGLNADDPLVSQMALIVRLKIALFSDEPG
jgi:hypothetical protein